MNWIAFTFLSLLLSAPAMAQIGPTPPTSLLSSTNTWSGGSNNYTGNVNVQGTLNSTANTSPAGTTNSGVAIGGGPNYALVQLFDAAQTANNRTSELISLSGAMQLRFKNDAGNSATPWLSAAGGFASGITGVTSNSGTGLWSHTGNMNVSGTFNATGTLGSSANNAVPSPTNSGVTIGGGSNWANAQFFDQAATANNRTAALNWSGGAFSFWFRSDGGTALTALTINGGQGSGITGITSTSGSGAWAHTGAFTTTGLATLSSGYTVAGLPTCNTGAKGSRAFVTDAATPTWNSPVAGGSSNTISVFCNGNSWVAG